MRLTIHNRVVLTLALLLLLAAGLPLLNWAPNRLVSGQPLFVPQLLEGNGLLLLFPAGLLIALVFLPQSRVSLGLMLICSELLLMALLITSGREAGLLAQRGSELARTSFGSGFWLSIALSLLIAAEAISHLTSHALWRLLLNGQIWLPVIVIIASGQLDQLALLKEYANRQEVFDQALSRHLLLLFGTLLPTLLIGLPLGWCCYRFQAVQSAVFPVLNIIQTVPSVALFGLLIAPLSGLARQFPWLKTLGVSGIGVAPALIALVLYALLPLVRSVVAGLQNVPREVTETAWGMGMTRSQIFWQAEMPLALPVMLAGLRVLTVQTMGMAVVAALIGAGGFGAIIFQGLFSSALELVLLGVIPVVAMAVIADGLFKFVITAVEAARP
ncbi:ABC transporter permease [Pantoea sp. MBD-2R]|uniref:ABC transporter permease n=1 Tax=unclassified Pantoea TaxID=2630326 RepID=UPI0011BE1BF0|nr:ABC transporter permease [Pantoea sp. CCBC3-3-1]